MIKNSTSDTKLNLKVLHLESTKDKLLGAVKYKESVLFLKTRLGIHTFFVKTPLDILILDKNKRIVRIKEELLPNRVYFWNLRYSLVLELPRGVVKKLKLKVGHMVEF
ncbi:MAG: DUF192 domain-containing protein [Candidatus Levybacteria bacterium]|nr:DUF192 domain-containing protein [Candidatus Levybacteria bacterium]